MNDNRLLCTDGACPCSKMNTTDQLKWKRAANPRDKNRGLCGKAQSASPELLSLSTEQRAMAFAKQRIASRIGELLESELY
jgi:hypothetical protein